METNLLDRMLNSYLAGQIPVTITLQNKIRVSGKIRAFDSYVIVMEGQKRRSCTVTPSRPSDRPAGRGKASAARGGPAGGRENAPRQTAPAGRTQGTPGAAPPDAGPGRDQHQQQHEGRPPEMDAGTEGGKIA